MRELRVLLVRFGVLVLEKRGRITRLADRLHECVRGNIACDGRGLLGEIDLRVGHPRDGPQCFFHRFDAARAAHIQYVQTASRLRICFCFFLHGRTISIIIERTVSLHYLYITSIQLQILGGLTAPERLYTFLF